MFQHLKCQHAYFNKTCLFSPFYSFICCYAWFALHYACRLYKLLRMWYIKTENLYVFILLRTFVIWAHCLLCDISKSDTLATRLPLFSPIRILLAAKLPWIIWIHKSRFQNKTVFPFTERINIICLHTYLLSFLHLRLKMQNSIYC